MNGKVLVAGVGNIFLGDDAFGFEVVNRLQSRVLPDHVIVADYGIRSYDLAYALMEPWDLIILVDALPRGGEPGTLYAFEPEISEPQDDLISVDAHAMNPVSVLHLVQAMGRQPAAPLLVVGCEPATVEPDPEGKFALSAPVSAAVDEAVRMVWELVTRACMQTSAA
jgi:hydrogenase maturation protease